MRLTGKGNMLLAFFLTPLIGLTQRPTPQVESDESIRQVLRSGDAKKIPRTLEEFNVPEEQAELYGYAAQQPTEEKLAWLALNPINGTRARILFLPCALIEQASAFLVIEGKQGWKIQTDEDFDCHYDEKVSLQLVTLSSAKQYDVLVRHACREHGTGYVEQHMQLFRVSGTGFKLALDKTDYLFVDDPSPSGNHEEKRSTFLPLGRGVLEETRETFGLTDDGEPDPASLRVERRTFRWSSGSRKFVATQFKRLQ